MKKKNYYQNLNIGKKRGFSEDSLATLIERQRLNPKKLKGTRLGETFKHINFSKPFKLLDVGCHVGTISNYLAKRSKHATILALDIEKEFVTIAKKFNKASNITYKCMNLFDLKTKNAFDYVLFLEILEHVDNPQEYLEKIFGLLKPGGKLILSTPNALSITNILYNLKRTITGLNYIKTEPRNTGSEKDHIYVWDKITLYRLIYLQGYRHIKYSFPQNKLTGGQSMVFFAVKPRN